MTVTCECGKVFEGKEVMFNGKPLAPKFCPECITSIRSAGEIQAKADRKAGLEESWKKFCPAAFQEFQTDRIPDKTMLAAILRWKYGPRGLMISGLTRAGKTRSAWQLLQREHFLNRTTAKVTGMDVMLYVEALMKEDADTGGWISERANADLLLLDDCFKAKMTPRAEEALFAIVDHRTQHGLPMIVTLNDSVDSLLPRLSDDRGAPLVARLKEFCEVLKV